MSTRARKDPSCHGRAPVDIPQEVEMAKREGLKRWIESERVRSKLRTLGFAAIYARARYLGLPEENLVAVPPSRETSKATKREVQQFIDKLQAQWARGGGRMKRRQPRQVLGKLRRDDGVLVEVKNPTVYRKLLEMEQQIKVLLADLKHSKTMFRERSDQLDRVLQSGWVKLGVRLRLIRIPGER
jgi:hypothetical protein